ncbi:hypothetical protein HY772_00630 [Candidatus Woesearchaeota archaeon]|nr:hypothetical protein [Candidatus Woesearchaeota archaeon]
MVESKEDFGKTREPAAALESGSAPGSANPTVYFDDFDDDTPTAIFVPKKIDSVIPPEDIERAILFDEQGASLSRPSMHPDLFDRLEQALFSSHSLYPHLERVRSIVNHLSVSTQVSRQGLEIIIDGIESCNFSSFELDASSSKDAGAAQEQKPGLFSYFARSIAGLEKIKNRSKDLHEGVYWLYSLLDIWKPPLRQMSIDSQTPHFASAIASSIADLRGLLRIDVGARDIFESYNRWIWQPPSCPSFDSHLQLSAIARHLACYKDGIPEQFINIGRQIPYIMDMKRGLKLHALLCALPWDVHCRVLEFVSSSIDDMRAGIDEGQTHEWRQNMSDELLRFATNAVRFYKKYPEVANEYVDAFSSDYTPISVRHAMTRISEQMRSLAEHKAYPAREAGETTGVHTTRMLEREEAAARDLNEHLADAAAFTIEQHNAITVKRGQEVATRFLTTIRLFREIDDSSRLLPFIKAYSGFMLGTADDEEQEFVGTILREIGSLVNYDRSWKSAFDKLIKKGPAPCPPELQESYEKQFGIRPGGVWDLREYQRKLYEHPDAVQRFLALVNQGIDAKLYDKFVRRSNDQGQQRLEERIVEERIVLVGGGCGDARKELKLVEYFELAGIDVSLVLIDNSRYMRNRAALNVHEAGIHFPPILNRDIEKITYEDLERDIDINTQMVFFLGGGTPFNMMNRWYCYQRLHEMFARRHEKRFGVSFSGDAPALLSGSFLPDILVTEGDLEKSMNYYASQDSLKFLSSGLEGEYSISSEAITVADGSTTLLINPTDEGLQFSYVLMRDQGPFKKGDVLLVIESGILNKQQFRSWLSGVGFDCQFIDGNYKNTLAISRLCPIDMQYHKLVESAIKGYESKRR